MNKICLVACVLVTLALRLEVSGQINTTIAEIKGSIKVLEEVTSNPNIPEQVKQDYALSLVEKRGQLAVLLQGELRAFQRQKANAQGSDNLTFINQKIEEIDQEIKQLLQRSVGLPPSLPAENVLRSVANPGIPVPIVPDTNKPPVLPAPTNRPTTSGTSAGGAVTPDMDANNPVASNTAQQDSDDEVKSVEERYRLRLQKAVAEIRTAKASDPRATIVEGRDLVLLLPLALAAPRVAKAKQDAVAELTAQAENARNDKQTGSGSSSSGSTALVTKGAVPAIFGFAVENGALTRTDSGTTVTFRGNPVGIIEAAAKRGYISGYQADSGFERALRNFAFGLSFDTSRGDSNGVFTAGKQQLSNFSFRYNFVNQRDPRDSRYTRLWEGLVSQQAVDVVRVLGRITRRLVIPQPGQPAPVEFTNWLTETKDVLRNASADEVESKLQAQLDKLQGIPLSGEIVELINSFDLKYNAYLKRRNDILGQIANGWLVTAEYTNDRPVGLPSISNINFIAEKGAFNGSIDLTANASLSFFNDQPSEMNTKRLRDFHFSGQLDIPFGDVTRTGKFLLAFAGRYERLLEDQLIPNTKIVIRKGDIGVFQAKFVIPIRGTAFKIPLSFSVANRTELLNEREIRGSFGFTFDLDSIFARFNPFSLR